MLAVDFSVVIESKSTSNLRFRKIILSPISGLFVPNLWIFLR